MPQIRIHQFFSMVFLLCGVIFAIMGMINHPFYSIRVFQLTPNILWVIALLMLVRPFQIQSIIGFFVSVLYYLRATAGRYEFSRLPLSIDNETEQGDKLRSTYSQLEELGLRFFGSFTVQYPHRDDANSTNWTYIDDTNTIIASISSFTNGMYGVEIRTEYPDGFVLATLFNVPLDVDSARFHIRSFEDLAEALDYHQYQASYLTAKHGEPVRFSTLETYVGTGEKEVAEKKAIAWDGGIAHLRAARGTILTMLICFVIGYSLTNLYHAAGIALVITSIAFWIEDFTILRKPVAQTMEQRKKQKALQQ